MCRSNKYIWRKQSANILAAVFSFDAELLQIKQFQLFDQTNNIGSEKLLQKHFPVGMKSETFRQNTVKSIIT